MFAAFGDLFNEVWNETDEREFLENNGYRRRNSWFVGVRSRSGTRRTVRRQRRDRVRLEDQADLAADGHRDHLRVLRRHELLCVPRNGAGGRWLAHSDHQRIADYRR